MSFSILLDNNSFFQGQSSESGRVLGRPSSGVSLASSSLDSKHTKLAVSSWTKKQRRAYHRLLSGIKLAESRGVQLRFLTLTSSPSSDWTSLNQHFQALVKRIQRRFGFKLQYWKIKTNEGNGVLHIVFKGRFLPQKWLSATWLALHGAKVVDIRQFRFGSRRLARYLVSNYLAKQSFERMSWSWGWVYRGFVSDWLRIVSGANSLKEALALWDRWLLGGSWLPFLRLDRLV
jgi:hypothetical protein